MAKVKRKTSVNRSLRKSDFWENNAPSPFPYQSRQRPLTSDEIAIINEPSNSSQYEYSPRQRPLTSDEKAIINEPSGVNGRKQSKISENIITDPAEIERLIMEDFYKNPSVYGFQMLPSYFRSGGFRSERLPSYGGSSFSSELVMSPYRGRPSSRARYPSRGMMMSSRRTSGFPSERMSGFSRNGMRSSAAMKRMSKRQAGPKPSKYFE